MFIAHLKYDIPTLKACAATCFCWYNIAIPHLHRTLVLRGWTSKKYRNQRSDLLPSLFKLGLLPFVEQLQFWGAFSVIFDSKNTRYLRAMVNLQTLTIGDLNFSKFPAGFGKHLGHFAPTLRSVSLSWPEGTRRQLLDFFRLFPKLDDIEISCYDARRDAYERLDNKIVPTSGGFRGRLTLNMFGEEGLLEDMVIAFGGMRFTVMELRKSREMRLLLGACADTLEVLRISPEDMYYPIANPSKVFFSPRKHTISSNLT